MLQGGFIFESLLSIRKFNWIKIIIICRDICLFSRYTEIANNFQKEETVLNIDFVLLDNSPLKFALLSHCNEWQNKFTTLLREMGSQKLLELHNFLKDNAKKWVLYTQKKHCALSGFD